MGNYYYYKVSFYNEAKDITEKAEGVVCAESYPEAVAAVEQDYGTEATDSISVGYVTDDRTVELWEIESASKPCECCCSKNSEETAATKASEGPAAQSLDYYINLFTRLRDEAYHYLSSYETLFEDHSIMLSGAYESRGYHTGVANTYDTVLSILKGELKEEDT